MKVRHHHRLILSLLLLPGCSGEVRTAPHGEAWPRLRERDRLAFMATRQLFRREFTAQRGLGPMYNATRCSSCHNSPSIGGAGIERVQKVSRFEAGRCDPLVQQGGDVLQQHSTEALAAYGITQEAIPDAANATGLVAPPALYGLAAIEAIPDEEILKRADANDANGDGISGRAGRTADGQLGRFGRKATVASLRAFVETELAAQMGLTTSTYPAELSVSGRGLPRGSDPARDPEVHDTTVSNLTQYLRLLAFPSHHSPRAAGDSNNEGARLFQRIGCAACHEPALEAGRSPLRRMRGKTIPLYSDLLLHDLGPGLAGACAPGAEPGEWRTAPLYGLRLRAQFMHDGRVQTIESAVRQHGGEAEASRALFDTLSPEEQAHLLRFLRSL